MGDNTTTCSGSSFSSIFDCGSGAALSSSGQSANTLLAAIGGSAASFAAQIFIFLLLRIQLARIYRPRSYLVPERERVSAPPKGAVAWLRPLFTTPNTAFIQKCGLDAYFFLRYLRMLLKLFLPIALVVLPILLPLNRYSGPGAEEQSGLDRLSISNVAPRHVWRRLWAHLLLAIGVTIWFCYIVYKELRGYIRVRQAYLTSPQHRIRASATTVLVTGIPRKWLTYEALSGLYDVFPGGIKNIWINRDFDELAVKVNDRKSVAKKLEAAETNLIRMCRKKHEAALEKKAKEEGESKKSKSEQKQVQEAEDVAADRMAQGQGISAGDQYTVPHGLQEALHEAEDQEERHPEHGHKTPHAFGIVGEGLNKAGFGAVSRGFGVLGKGVDKFGQKVVGDVNAGFRNVGNDFDRATNVANNGVGFVTDEELYRQSVISHNDGAPTPPPKTPAEEREARLDIKPRPLAISTAAPGDEIDSSPESERTLGPPSIRMARPSVESRPRSNMQIEEPAAHQVQNNPWMFWKNHDHALAMPSPQPHTADEDEFPLTASTVRASKTGRPPARQTLPEVSDIKTTKKLMFWKKKSVEAPLPKQDYGLAINKDWDEDQDEEPRWRHYLEPKDRDTMRLPVAGWFPAIPFVGEKVDKIYYLRRELARLNLEIEADQADVEKFPFMNSAFIQFNHQVAAHMACQALSHHVPQQMAPRQLEISPDDVLWDNMSIKWWERYVRTILILIVCAGLIVLYAVPVTFTSLLSKVNVLAQEVSWLKWLNKLPTSVIAIIQGLLPPALLSLILLLVPIIFRALITQQGVATGNARELVVQKWYFAFLFIQVFFVVTLAGGLTTFVTEIADNPGHVISSLAQNLPKAADYFFSYLMVQGLSSSASGLLQIFRLFMNFIWGRLFDNTARAKWKRQTYLSNVQWGTFFPPFTNFAVIGLIYSIIAPLILFFMLIIFSLFWIVYRYNVLYVYQFRNDTGGLLFPTALNQLFTGIYFLQICLIGFFFISQNEKGDIACIPQGVIMIVVAVFTAVFQWQLNLAFDPLFQYLPITLEDEAVIRDEEFVRVQANKSDDIERQHTTVGDVLFSGFADELEDLTSEERDTLVRYAFQHSALRAKRPVVWIPRDKLGVSDDEIKRAQRMSTVSDTTYIWMSNEGTALDGKGRVVFRRSPPDFSNASLIAL